MDPRHAEPPVGRIVRPTDPSLGNVRRGASPPDEMADHLTAAEERALRALARCPDCTHAEVAEMLGVTPNRLYVTLARLENSGLVRSRVEREGSHSVRRFGLTPDGLQTILTPPDDAGPAGRNTDDDSPPIVGRAPDATNED